MFLCFVSACSVQCSNFALFLLHNYHPQPSLTSVWIFYNWKTLLGSLRRSKSRWRPSLIHDVPNWSYCNYRNYHDGGKSLEQRLPQQGSRTCNCSPRCARCCPDTSTCGRWIRWWSLTDCRRWGFCLVALLCEIARVRTKFEFSWRCFDLRARLQALPWPFSFWFAASGGCWRQRQPDCCTSSSLNWLNSSAWPLFRWAWWGKFSPWACSFSTSSNLN